VGERELRKMKAAARLSRGDLVIVADRVRRLSVRAGSPGEGASETPDSFQQAR
jgi:hypothetical protein